MLAYCYVLWRTESAYWQKSQDHAAKFQQIEIFSRLWTNTQGLSVIVKLHCVLCRSITTPPVLYYVSSKNGKPPKTFLYGTPRKGSVIEALLNDVAQ